MATNSIHRVLTPLELIRNFCDSDVEESDRLEDLGLDSLELLDLELECERYFNRPQTPEDYAQMRTVKDLADAFRSNPLPN